MKALAAIVVLVVVEYDAAFGAGAARREAELVSRLLGVLALLALAVAGMFDGMGG